MAGEMGAAVDDLEGAALQAAETVQSGSWADELEAAQLSPDDDGGAIDRRIGMPCPCRKTKKGEFFRARPGPEWTRYYFLYQMQEGEEIASDFYLVHPSVAGLLEGAATPCEIRYCINRNGAPFLFPIKKGENTRDYYKNTLQAALTLAESKWLRIKWEKALGGYSIFVAQEDLGEPGWPDETIPDMKAAIDLCFRDHYIKDENHPAILRFRGIKEKRGFE
jgi:hypothetical protein